jgi:arylsulfatase
MCSPSRAAFFSGHPPQVNGVFDQMETGWVPSLRKDQPNMGSMMKKLGYQTAFFGKWEMDLDLIPPKPTVNYSEALQPYGFDIYQPDGDKVGTPNQGYDTMFTQRAKASAGSGAMCLRCANPDNPSS